MIDKITTDQLYEITFHAIGGQGAYTTGQMLANNISKISNIQTSVFANYGSEKKGAHINVFIKIKKSENNIRDYSHIQKSDLVVIFHEKLLNKNILKDTKHEHIILVNTSLSPKELKKEYNLHTSHIYTIDATKISLELNSKINTIMYGALVKITNIIDKETSIKEIESKFKYKYPHLIEKNINAFLKGYDQIFYDFFDQMEHQFPENIDSLNYANQLEGGVILGCNTQTLDRSISREGYLPIFNKELCINCTKCDITCPDDCFIWKEEIGRKDRKQMVLQGIDYDFCKGCMRCVTACPTQALTKAIEDRNIAKNLARKKYEDDTNDKNY